MPVFERFTTASASGAALTAIRELMDHGFDGDFTDEDWDHTIGGWHFTAVEGGTVVSHAAVVHRVIEVDGKPFRTGYVEGVATHPQRQGEGLGSAVMAAANQLILDSYELGALGTGRYSFYRRLGWERWLGPTFVRTDTGPVRTPDEDDAIMVLRFGPSEAVDLRSPISCEERPGDDW